MGFLDFLFGENEPAAKSKTSSPAYKAGRKLYADVRHYFANARQWKDLSPEEREAFVDIWWRIYNKGSVAGYDDCMHQRGLDEENEE